jgi:hypothetical protein
VEGNSRKGEGVCDGIEGMRNWFKIRRKIREGRPRTDKLNIYCFVTSLLVIFTESRSQRLSLPRGCFSVEWRTTQDGAKSLF